jgi:biotin transport system substrate-specific component
MQTTTQAALAPSLVATRSSRTLSEVALVLIGTAVLVASAKISVPFYPVPMTLQTLAVMAIAAAYGTRLGTLTVLAYLAEGFGGLPVFTATPPMIAGPAYFLGPTGGFLAGFVLLALIVGYAADSPLASPGWRGSLTCRAATWAPARRSRGRTASCRSFSATFSRSRWLQC